MVEKKRHLMVLHTAQNTLSNASASTTSVFRIRTVAILAPAAPEPESLSLAYLQPNSTMPNALHRHICSCHDRILIRQLIFLQQQQLLTLRPVSCS